VQVVPRVTGRVIEVPVQPNVPVKKGDVLFRIDPTPFQQELLALEARVPELSAKLDSAEAYQRELDEQLRAARGTRDAASAKLALAQKRLGQTRELSSTGAGPRYDYEQAQADVQALGADVSASSAQMQQIRQKMSAKTKQGELSEVAQARAALQQLRAQIVEKRWQLDQATYRAPANGRVVNLQLREGSYAAAIPLNPVMSFVEDEQMVLALFYQNELRNVQPGDEAEIALRVYPNRIIKTTVDSVVWASGTGQLPLSGTVPGTQAMQPVPPGKYAVRLRPHGRDAKAFLPMGAQGQGAIYTQYGKIVHIVRRVILRVGTKIDWLVLKLH